MKENLRYEFMEPAAKYRAKPFWAWNGNLEKQELIRQIHIMKKMGFGGFFMHSRTGLQTEYLGDEWFQMVNACADEGETMGMEAWLYDEDRWPSGIAGGLVTEKDEYRARFLEMKISGIKENIHTDGEVVAVFRCKLRGYEFWDLRCLEVCGDVCCEKPEFETDEEEVLLTFSIVPSECKDVYNGFSYLDTMDRHAVECFLDITHEKYLKNCGARIGKSICGIFTDEPHRGAMFTTFSEGKENRIPYTRQLFSAFRNRYGYDLREKLPYLFLRERGISFSKIAIDYIELCQVMFLENFAQPIQQWCAKHNMIFTGHVLHEDSLSAQTVMQGSLMRFYEYMDYPGIDILTEKNNCWWVVKQAESIARQMGKPFVLSELYGGTGWQMSLENYKQVGDWQTLFGINLRCPHLSWYTMKGEAKRDYPASIFYQSAWYEEYEKLETYFARAGMFMSQGETDCEVLLINPIESVWGYSRSGAFDGLEAADEKITRLEEQYKETFRVLVSGHVEFDYGDESILERYGSVKKGELLVGKCSYGKVLVSGVDTIRQSTLKLLTEFKKQGGMVIFAGGVPQYVDGLPSEDGKEFAETCNVIPCLDNVVQAVYSDNRCMSIKGEGASEILSRIRKEEDTWYIMFLNSNYEKTYDQIQIDFNEDVEVELWDARTGKIHKIPYNFECPGRMSLSFAPGEEKFFRLQTRKREAGIQKSCFEYQLSEENVLVLDMVTARIQEQMFLGEILKVDREIRKYLGMPARGGEMLQPWYIKKYANELVAKTNPVELVFPFWVQKKLKGKVWLAIEDLQHVENMELNGKKLGGKSQKQWIDPCFSCIEISEDKICEGKNELKIEYRYHILNGLETVYLLGGFGVYKNSADQNWRIGELPSKLCSGDITVQGLPFYSGKIRYKIQNATGKCKLHNLKFTGSCIKVMGEDEQVIFAPPYSCEVDNLKAIEVVLTRRNTFGPLHCSCKYLDAYGPEKFLTEGEQWQDEHSLLEQGLLEDPQIEKISQEV